MRDFESLPVGAVSGESQVRPVASVLTGRRRNRWRNSVNEIEQTMVSSDSDELSFPVPSRKDIGWLLVGGGVVGALVTLLRGQRSLVDFAVPLSLIGLGSCVLLKRRQTHMAAAEESIRAELDNLDPIARAQVLKAVAREQMSRLPGVDPAD